MGGKYYILITAALGLLIINIQQLNDIVSREQNDNFNRLIKIESFLCTDVVKNLKSGEYFAKDLYKRENILAIHSGYWTTYCNMVLGLPIQIIDTDSELKQGNIYYDEDNFVIVTPEKIIVLSQDKEDRTKAIPVTEEEFLLFDFSNESVDGDFYVYSAENEN